MNRDDQESVRKLQRFIWEARGKLSDAEDKLNEVRAGVDVGDSLIVAFEDARELCNDAHCEAQELRVAQRERRKP